ncbi:hypothetical protein [Lampropedia cohaerens]|nr:hypothetical protein [Lampropedia cohaerens]
MDTPQSLTERLAWQIDQLLARLAAAETDNQQLRQQLATVNAENHTLQERMHQARERLDAVLAQLPPEIGSEETQK